MLKVKFFTRCILIILGGFTLLQTIFCSKEGGSPSFNCPAFSDAVYDTWFPYVRGQVIRFRNAAGAENTITIDHMEKTSKHTYYRTIGQACIPKVSVRSSEPGPSSIPFGLEYTIEDFMNLNISLKKIQIFARSVSDTGIIIRPARFSHTRFFANLSLNGINYSDVQMVTRDTITDKETDIYKVFIAKKVGILAYEEFPSLALWAKQ